MKGFIAVVLAGGSGERFWPLSTPERPKQFLRVFGNDSLLRQCVARLSGIAGPGRVFVVTSADLVAPTREDLPEMPDGNVIGEPVRRDTGAAVAIGTAAAGDGDPVVGFFPSDQLVGDARAFRRCVAEAVRKARSSASIVVIGVKPVRPAVEFGYVDPLTGAFAEKPRLAAARKYLSKGYLWNAGMFIARKSVFTAAFDSLAPALSPLARLNPPIPPLEDFYGPLPRVSFDKAVMEKLPRGGVEVVPGDFGWDDVGSLAAFDKYFPHDSDGNVREGPVAAVDSQGNIAVSRAGKIALLGVKNLVVVSAGGSVLVADKSRLGEMKRLFAR